MLKPTCERIKWFVSYDKFDRPSLSRGLETSVQPIKIIFED